MITEDWELISKELQKGEDSLEDILSKLNINNKYKIKNNISKVKTKQVSSNQIKSVKVNGTN